MKTQSSRSSQFLEFRYKSLKVIRLTGIKPKSICEKNLITKDNNIYGGDGTRNACSMLLEGDDDIKLHTY